MQRQIWIWIFSSAFRGIFVPVCRELILQNFPKDFGRFHNSSVDYLLQISRCDVELFQTVQCHIDGG
jgi:hypothetical protein